VTRTDTVYKCTNRLICINSSDNKGEQKNVTDSYIFKKSNLNLCAVYSNFSTIGYGFSVGVCRNSVSNIVFYMLPVTRSCASATTTGSCGQFPYESRSINCSVYVGCGSLY